MGDTLIVLPDVDLRKAKGTPAEIVLGRVGEGSPVGTVDRSVPG